ncbi:MAG: hypothetical protein IJV88_06535 [Ruminococcus sp.]|nr:hypothetical protein [Ruminococcus sp.]
MKKEKRTFRLISQIIILVLVVIMGIGTTSSWYNRTQNSSQTGAILSYEQTGKVNGTGCTLQTFLGTNDNGVVDYSDTEQTEAVTVAAGSTVHFETVVTNSGNNGAASVSLYLKSSAQSYAAYIGVRELEKTYKPFTGISSGGNYYICIEDNIPVENDASSSVYWFIKSDAALTIDPNNLYVVYN